MPSTPGNPQVSLGVRDGTGKNTSVISQVNRPLWRDEPPVSKARISYVEVTSFKLIPFSAFWANGGG